MDPVVSLSARRTLQLLLTLVVVLTIVGWLLQYLELSSSPGTYDPRHITGIPRLFDLGGKANIPTWYKASLLMFSCVLLFVIALARKRMRDVYWHHWRDLAVVFLLLSIDEVAAIHEGIGYRLSLLLETSGVFFYAWVIVGIMFVVLFSMLYLRFVLSLPVMAKILFLTSGVVYVGSVLGLKMLEGWYVTTYGMQDLTFITISSVRQAIEMSAIVVFDYALLTYIRHNVEDEILRVYV
jgi:hypothetical protein